MLEEIKHILPSLSKSERRVGELILDQPNLIIHTPIAQIADMAHVSQPTVIRFCRTLRCSGLQDFKLRLNRSLDSNRPYVHSLVQAEDSTREFAKKLFDNNIAQLMRARNEIDINILERAIKLLSLAKRIEFYGQGASGIIAMDAQDKLFRLGIPTNAYSDPYMHGMSAAMLSKEDVVVAISHSGQTKELIQSTEIARGAGASVIGITPSKSPLAKACTLTLYTGTIKGPDVYIPMISRIVYLVIVDILAVGVALQRGPALIDRFEKMKVSLKGKYFQHGTD